MPRRIALAVLVAAGCATVVDGGSPDHDAGTSAGAGATTSSTSTTRSASTATSSGAGGVATGGGSAGSAAGGGDGGTPSEAALLDAFCTPFAAWYCAMAPSCGCATTAGWPGSTAACAQTVRGDCLADAADFLAQGMVFRPDHAATCLAALEASGDAGCLGRIGLPSAWTACGIALASTEPIDAPCTSAGGECAGGDGACFNRFCIRHAALGASCESAVCAQGAFCNASQVCKAPLTAGAACTADGECALGLWCDGAGVCAAPLLAGHACATGDACAAGLRCDGGTCQASPTVCMTSTDCGSAPVMSCVDAYGTQCQAPLALGAGCGPGYPCVAGAVCDANFTSTTCVAVPGAGAACPDRVCQAGLGCDEFVTFTCQPPAAAGKPCNVGPDAVQCATGLACSNPGSMGATCIPVDGPTCAEDSDCPAGERCAIAGVCRAPGALGDVCGAAAPCAAADVCDAARCKQLGDAGAVCPDDFTVCAVGLACVTGAHAGHGTCQPPPTMGQACDIDARCATGLACGYVPWGAGTCAASVCIAPPPFGG